MSSFDSSYAWYWLSVFPLIGYPFLFGAFQEYLNYRNLRKQGQKCMAIIINKYHQKGRPHRIDYQFTHHDEQYTKQFKVISVRQWKEIVVNQTKIEIIYDPNNPNNNLMHATFKQSKSNVICILITFSILSIGIIFGFGLGFGIGLAHLEWYHLLNITITLPMIECFVFYVFYVIGSRIWKQNFKIDPNATEEQQNAVRYSILRIFTELVGVSLLISLVGSGLIGLQYLIIHLSFATVGTPYSAFFILIVMLPFRVWLKIYTWFLLGYNSYILNLQMVDIYKIKTCIGCSTFMSFLCSFCGWLIIIIVWSVYFVTDLMDYYDIHHEDNNFDQELTDYMNHKLNEITSIDSAYCWSIGILMSPVWICSIIYIMVAIFTVHSIKKQLQINGTSASLLVNDDFNLLQNWKINKKLIYRVVLIHLLLLFTWIVWKWLTAPHIFSAANGTNDIIVNRDNALLSYWSLYIFTTIIKYVCKCLLSIKNETNQMLLFEIKRLKTMITILTSILFAFGLKFVFSNIKQWKHFLVVSVINMILKIFVNGSLQSHQYGKRFINAIKIRINNCCCCTCKMNVTDFSDLDKVIDYNKDLAFNLSLNFLISTVSSLIMMTYFGLMMLIYSVKINHKVFIFMAASFGIDCVTYFGEIISFKKRDRKYLTKLIWSKVAKNISDKNKPVDQFSAVEILAVCLVLSWFWVGSITVGPPADFK